MATSAAKGDLKELRRLTAFVRFRPENEAILAFPAFFVNLDPSGIPSVAELDVETSAPFPSVERAVVALSAMPLITVKTTFPRDAYGDIWPRVWAWLEFLHSYRDHIPGMPTLDGRSYVTWCLLIKTLSLHKPIADLIARQRGVSAFVTRAWIMTVDAPAADREDLQAYADCLMLLHPGDPANFSEILEEAGGTLDSLANLTVRHLASVIPGKAEVLPFVTAVVTFLDDAEDTAGPFNDALLANGVITALVKVFFVADLVGSVYYNLDAMRFGLLRLIKRRLLSPPGYLAMSEALDAGLLRVILLCYKDAMTKDILDLLPNSLVYYSVASRMGQCLRDVTTQAANLDFRQSTLYPVWMNLINVFERRLRVLNSFTSTRSLKACDNMDCPGKIRPKTQFHRCGGCQSVYYCASECQSSDWKSGGHREICPHLASLRKREPPLSVRERSYMRAVLHDDHHNSYRQVLPHLMDATRTYPGIRFFTLFDYTNPSGLPEILPKATTIEFPDATPDWKAVWNHYAARVGRSRATLELHLMAVMEGSIRRMRLYPMRSVSDGIRAAGNRIFQNKGWMEGIRNFDELQTVMSRALDAEGPLDLLQIH
ncbi:hypothetical protein DFH06DRAFT_757165 [Mycena polygramma]|nr:hypothetical protein DFH06DRAFT_757165 [Mycena polygramma]